MKRNAKKILEEASAVVMAASLVVTMFGGIRLAQNSVSDETKPASSSEESGEGSGAETDNSEKRRIELLFGNQGSGLDKNLTAYGTKSVEFDTSQFKTLDEAKAYVRENYLLGLASQFNVFVRDDIVMHAADIEGRAAVGGVEQTVNKVEHPNEPYEQADLEKNIPDTKGHGVLKDGDSTDDGEDNILAFDASPIGYYYEIGTGHKINIIEYSHGECTMVEAKYNGKLVAYDGKNETGDINNFTLLTEGEANEKLKEKLQADGKDTYDTMSDDEKKQARFDQHITLWVPAYTTGESAATAKKDVNLTALWEYVYGGLADATDMSDPCYNEYKAKRGWETYITDYYGEMLTANLRNVKINGKMTATYAYSLNPTNDNRSGRSLGKIVDRFSAAVIKFYAKRGINIRM